MSTGNSDIAFIKLFVKFLNWEWYTDVNTKVLFIHCLLRANWKSGSWKGIDYSRGQFITSLETLANETGLTIKQVRTAILHLERTGEITSKGQGRARIITVCNYNQYQAKGKQNDTERAGYGQDEGKEGATVEEYKESKKIKKKRDKPLRGRYFEDPNEPLNDPKLLEPYLDCDIFLNKEVERAVMIRRKELGLDE